VILLSFEGNIAILVISADKLSLLDRRNCILVIFRLQENVFWRYTFKQIISFKISVSMPIRIFNIIY